MAEEHLGPSQSDEWLPQHLAFLEDEFSQFSDIREPLNFPGSITDENLPRIQRLADDTLAWLTGLGYDRLSFVRFMKPLSPEAVHQALPASADEDYRLISGLTGRNVRTLVLYDEREIAVYARHMIEAIGYDHTLYTSLFRDGYRYDYQAYAYALQRLAAFEMVLSLQAAANPTLITEQKKAALAFFHSWCAEVDVAPDPWALLLQVNYLIKVLQEKATSSANPFYYLQQKQDIYNMFPGRIADHSLWDI